MRLNNEIASSFVLLTPRNDGILDGILTVIPRSSWGMIKGLRLSGQAGQ